MSLQSVVGSSESVQERFLKMLKKEEERAKLLVERSKEKEEKKAQALKEKEERLAIERVERERVKAETEEKNAVIYQELRGLEAERENLDARIKELKKSLKTVRADGQKNDTFWRKFQSLEEAEKFRSEQEAIGNVVFSITDYTENLRVRMGKEEAPHYLLKFRDTSING
jgi:hypothetical protein